MTRDYYRRLADASADRYGLPRNLVRAVTGVESNWESGAVSPKGAGGLMQIMPGTAAYLGYTSEDRFDPVKNMDMGAKYLREMLDRYNGDFELMLAAYNAGPGAVDKYGGVPPYEETRNYVRKVMGRIDGGGQTGGQAMTDYAERSLPPEMHELLAGANLDFSPIEAQPYQDPMMGLMTNPLFHLGIGLLSSNNTGEGLSAGMKNALAAQKMQQQYTQNQIANEQQRRQQQLQRQNLLLQYTRMQGYEQLNPWQRHQVDQARRQQANLEAKIDRERYSEPQTVGTPDGDARNAMRVVWDKQDGVYRQVLGSEIGPAVDLTGMVDYREESPGRLRETSEGRGAGGGGGVEGLDPDKASAVAEALGALGSLEDKAFGTEVNLEGERTGGAFTGVDEGWFDRGVAGLGNLWNKINQSPGGMKAEQYQRELESVLGLFSRMFGEKGVLSNQDIVRIAKRLPQADFYPDTEAYARDVFNELRAALEDKYRIYSGSDWQGSSTSSPASSPATKDLTDEELLKKRDDLLKQKSNRWQSL